MRTTTLNLDDDAFASDPICMYLPAMAATA